MMRTLFVILLLLPLQWCLALEPAGRTVYRNGILGSDSLCHKVDSSDAVARERTFDYFFLQALSLREQERYDEAFDLFEHCFALQPGSSAVSYELFSMYSFLGRKEEALAMMQRAAKGDPDNYWYRAILAIAYENEGLFDEAIEVYKTMAKDFSSNSNVFAALASAYTDKGDYKSAIESFDQIERIEGKNEQITLQKYRLYMLLQDKENALKELQGLIDEFPDDLSTKVFLGSTYMQFGDTLKALDIYDGVYKADSNNVQVQKAIADYYQRADNDSLFTVAIERLLYNERFVGKERAELLVKFVTYKDGMGDSLYNIALMKNLMSLPVEQALTAETLARYMEMNAMPHDSIAPVLEALLRFEPENGYAQMQLLNEAIQKNNYDEVIMRCDTAILYNPEILELYYFKGVAEYNKNMHKEALGTFLSGLSKRTDDDAPDFISDLFALVGDIHHELGNMDDCYSAYDSALVYNANNLGALNNYAYFLSLDGRELDKAEQMSYKTVEAEPENKTYIDTYMWILFVLERYDEAKAYAEKLLSLGKEDEPVVLEHCGDIFAKCGDTDRAVELWSEAQNNGGKSKILEKKIKRRKYISDGKKKKKK